METRVQIGNGPETTIEELEKIVAEAKRLRDKRIRHDRKLIRELGNPNIAKRLIHADYDPLAPDFGYLIEDSIKNSVRPIVVGEAEYLHGKLRR